MKKFLKGFGQHIVPPLLYFLMRLLWFTLRKKYHYLTPIDAKQHVCVTWHGELLLTPQAYRKVHPYQAASAIISAHRDGGIMAGVLAFLRIRALRGSSRKGAKQVLLEAFRSIKKGEEVLITPDGPKGPRHHMSDGAVGIALKSNLPIFVMNFTADAFWQTNTWDSFVIPKPFSKIDFYMQSLSLEGQSLQEAKQTLLDAMLQHTILKESKRNEEENSKTIG
jgi:hypothetical protein